MSIVEFLSQPLWQRLGLTLVHFLWQGLAIAVLVGVLVRVFRLKHGNSRYAAYLLAFVAMIACPVVTFTAIDIPLSPNTEPIARIQSAEVIDTSSYTILPAGDILPEAETSPPLAVSIPLSHKISDWLHVSIPWILVIWMVGVIVLSGRLLMGFVGVYRWRHHLEPLPERLARRITSLSERLGMRRFSQVFVSPAVLQAMAVGYLRPMVLLPAAMVTQMQPEMLEAVIAHELAHIRRFDLWVNLAQRVTETLLFYHPAVWWLSNCIRSERELCCDELAVKATGERITYATTLERLGRARLMAKQPVLAMGLGQDNKPTLSRVRHILGLTPTQRNCPFWLAGVIAVVFLVGLLIPTALALSSRKNEQADIKNDKVRVYQVNRNVSDFPEAEDFSTPESAYAAINRVMAAEDYEGWQRVSIKSLADRLKKEQQVREKKVDSEWSKVVLNARILEVRMKGDCAAVIAELPQKLSSKPIKEPIDCRHLEFEDGKWLNTGEDRYDTIEQAREKFDKIFEKNEEQKLSEEKLDHALEYSDEIKQAAQRLFDGIKNADYEAFLSSKNKTWWNDFPTWDSYMAVKWHDELVKWICNTFKENPIVKIELGEVFISDVKAVDLKNLPAVPYKLTLKDDGIIEGNLPFRYFSERKGSQVKAYWQGLHGIDWHLQENPIKNSTGKVEQFWQRLKEPVTVHIDKSPDGDRLTVQYAVMAVCKAANVPYNWDKSAKYANPQRRNYIEPVNIENIPANKVLESILTPVGLGYDSSSEGLFLYRLGEYVPQILTSGYILSVPADLPQLKDVISEDKSKTKMITPEELDAFLNVVRNTPQARMISAPKLLTNDGEVGEIRTKNAEGFESIKLNIKNTVQADRKTVMLDLDFEYRDEQNLISTSTKTAILSKHAIAVAGGFSKDQAVLLLITPEILEKPFSKTGIVATDTMEGEVFRIADIKFEPIKQGKNVVWITVENKSDKNEFFGVNVYSRSVDYGPQGVGWGTTFYEKFDARQTKKLRYVYKIQGPVTKNTYTRLWFYNAKSLEHNDNKDLQPFAKKQYTSDELEKFQSVASDFKPVSKLASKTFYDLLEKIQMQIRNKDYESVWTLFSDDYKKAEYQSRGIERFKQQMELKHSLDSAFNWEKEDFVKLEPKPFVINRNGVVILDAKCEGKKWTICFAMQDGLWKIDDIVGYNPKILDMQEADNN